MGAMVILMATAMDTMVTGIVAIMVQDVAPVIGDEIPIPTYSLPRPSQVFTLLSSRKAGLRVGRQNPL